MNCGPCALSALVGLPASTWEDRPMGIQEFEAIAREAGAIRLPHSDFAIGRKLGAFGNRNLPECSGRYDGEWLLLLGMGSEVHAVAVSCSTSPYRRWLVDNRERVRRRSVPCAHALIADGLASLALAGGGPL